MTLHAEVSVRRGTFAVEAELDAPAGEVTAVLGPNGAGKSTLLACLAGLLPIDAGRISLGTVVLDEPPSTFVPPEGRRMGIVHQDGILFPHLSAVDNVAFGLRCAGRTRSDARGQADEWLERAGVAAQRDLLPRDLSGGQAQRVALARALAPGPDALLLDEPLGALDAGARVAVRRDLGRVIRAQSGPVVLVTHDPVDALALADRVVVIEAGRVVQAGLLAAVTTRPRSGYVADLLGTNLLRGTAVGTTVTTDHGVDVTVAERMTGPVFLTVPPSAVALHRRRPEGSPRNRWSTTVAHLEPAADRVRVHLAGPLPLVAEITPGARSEMDLAEGSEVWATVKATEVAVYPR